MFVKRKGDYMTKKMAMQKEIIFPCGDKLVATSDYGHAYGLVIAHEPVDGEGGEKIINQCKGCTKCNKIVCIRNYRKKATGKEKKYKDTICVGYSQAYLDNKDRPTTTCNDEEFGNPGPYNIEVVFQVGDFRRVEYLMGNNENCKMFSLMDCGIDDLLEKAKGKDDPCYHLLMFNIKNGQINDIEFEDEDHVKNSIVSVRMLQPLRYWENIKDVITPGGTPMYICPVCKSNESKHLYGLEFTENRKNRCPHCGRHLKYPGEKRS